MQIDFYSTDFRKILKFHENPYIRSRAAECGCTDGRTDMMNLISFSQLCERAYKTNPQKNAEWRVKGKKQKFKKNSSRPRMKIKQSTTWQEIQTFGKIPILTNTSRPDYNKVQAATGSARELTATFRVHSLRNQRKRSSSP
jgi:hypothetical protein